MGYLLNKTEVNCSAALEKLCTAWAIRAESSLSDDKSIPPRELVRILKRIPPVPASLVELVAIQESAAAEARQGGRKGRHATSSLLQKSALIVLDDMTDRIDESETIENLYEEIGSTVSTMQCVAFAHARTNTHKHLLAGIGLRTRRRCLVEWVLAAKALVGVASLRSQMLSGCD